ncbi:sigma-70 family RNA polymerase sigma factor [Candidatus Poribacteria bacterium]|nr:sigma-70 family RNA polymerase sigma factor [Candidatus Poribacteria bacterium]
MALSEIELIQRTLNGDETAFGFLVDKYKGAIHALAYRKLGDFHLAEEITQDTFLKAYQKLSTLKDWHRFLGWLYVIASRLCLMWQRKNRLPTQSIDNVGEGQINSLAFREYADQKTREKVHDALESLPESERTVLTLHYLAGMTCEEIGRFIGTSRGAILNRLYRARCRLKEEMIPMMQQTFQTIQLPPTFTQRVIRQIRDLQPAPSPRHTVNRLSRGLPQRRWLSLRCSSAWGNSR